MNKQFIYLTAQVIDGYWHVWDMEGDSSDYYERGKAGIDRLIRNGGTDNDGNFYPLYFKMFDGKNNVRATSEVTDGDFPSVPNDVKKNTNTTTKEFQLTTNMSEQEILALVHSAPLS